MSRPTFDDLARRVLSALPPGLAEADADLRRNLRAGLTGALSRMDLVTREEFDAQARVLARTREKLERLEARLHEIEVRSQGPARPTGAPRDG
jgi:BMFP domain-containing protein YqiC